MDLGGGGEEHAARRDDDEHEQDVAATALDVATRIERAGHAGLAVRAVLPARRVAVRPRRGVRRGGRLGRRSGSGVDRRLPVQMLTRTAGSRRPLQRRLGERPTHHTERAARRCGRALQRVELAAEVGHRRVRMVLDPGSQHRWDEDSGPCGGDDEKDELSHE